MPGEALPESLDEGLETEDGPSSRLHGDALPESLEEGLETEAGPSSLIVDGRFDVRLEEREEADERDRERGGFMHGGGSGGG